jgi:hypothetical protein
VRNGGAWFLVVVASMLTIFTLVLTSNDQALESTPNEPSSGGTLKSQMPRQPSSIAARSSKLIADHRLRAFLITAALILLIADSGRIEVAGEDAQTSVLTWVAVGLIVLGAIETFIAPRLVAPNVRLGIAWSLGMTPFLFGFAALMAGSPILVMWLGLVVSLCLIASVALFVDREARAGQTPS